MVITILSYWPGRVVSTGPHSPFGNQRRKYGKPRSYMARSRDRADREMLERPRVQESGGKRPEGHARAPHGTEAAGAVKDLHPRGGLKHPAPDDSTRADEPGRTVRRGSGEGGGRNGFFSDGGGSHGGGHLRNIRSAHLCHYRRTGKELVSHSLRIAGQAGFSGRLRGASRNV